MEFENKLELGVGVYTPSEVASILHLPYQRVKRWIDRYWDGELGREYQSTYSWKVGKSQAVSFHTLIEFYILVQFGEAGVKTRQVLIAHKQLMRLYETAFPFAHKEVLSNIRTDGYKIYLIVNGHTVTLDKTKQLNLEFLRIFYKKLDFDNELLASRFWPLGKSRSILIDPKRKFGRPVINGYNIYPETIYSHFKAGDSEEYLAYLYELTPKEIKDALDYCEAA